MNEWAQQRRVRWPLLVLAGLCAAIGLLALIGPLLTYFFVFDDYKLVGQALELSITELVVRPHFHYFRPAVHALMALEAAAFGWRLPAGYAMMGLALHVLNAAMLSSLLRRLGFAEVTALFAGCVFLLAPWSMEAIFWVSCRFELLATACLLCALHVGLAIRSTASWRQKALFFVVMMAACLSKESGAVALCLVLALSRSSALPGSKRMSRSLWRLGLATVLVYALLRVLVMTRFGDGDPLAGEGGNLFALLMGAEVWQNLRAHLVAIAIPRLSAEWSGAAWLHAALIAIGLLSTLRCAPKKGAVSLLVALAVLLPALWLPRDALSTQGGRLLYLPSLVIAPMVAFGWVALVEPRGWRACVCGSLFVVWASFATLSAHHQGTLWSAAYGVSKQALHDVRERAKGAEAYHVENLPFVMREGPYLLKHYAFRWYEGGVEGSISATPAVYEMRDGNARQVRSWGTPKGALPSGATPIRL